MYGHKIRHIIILFSYIHKGKSVMTKVIKHPFEQGESPKYCFVFDWDKTVANDNMSTELAKTEPGFSNRKYFLECFS